MTTIYKICTAAEWEAAARNGTYAGSAVDRRDGFIHFSTAKQVAETARRHFTAQEGLVLIAFDSSSLGPGLREEPSRGGDLFPHLYGVLQTKFALWVRPLPLVRGAHVFPELA